MPRTSMVQGGTLLGSVDWDAADHVDIPSGHARCVLLEL